MYYPKSEILQVLYTAGSEFLIKRTRQNYVGYLYRTNDGTYFSGKEYTSDTKELVKLNNILDLGSYNKTVSYEFHYPVPTEKDYEKGSFVRYVIKRVNSGLETILEVNKEEYEKAKKNPLYTAVSFSWKLTGPLYDTEVSKDYTIPGIVNTNQKTIESLETQVPGVKNYFTNLAQYAK